jgi:hypothetical protein
MCIRREKARQSFTFSPVSKPHAHITYMLRQCTSIVYLLCFWSVQKVRHCYKRKYQQIYDTVLLITFLNLFILLIWQLLFFLSIPPWHNVYCLMYQSNLIISRFVKDFPQFSHIQSLNNSHLAKSFKGSSP